MKRLIAIVALTSVVFVGLTLHAAPHNGDKHRLQQPDGSLVDVRIYGDEYYQRVETPEGYTLVRESDTAWIVFARLSDDGNAFLSTGIRYTGPESIEKAERAALQQHLKISIEARNKAARANRKRMTGSETSPYDEPRADVVGDLLGVTLLVDFSDQPAVVPAGDLEQLINGVGFTGYDNRGSMRAYYEEMSQGRLNYTNFVTNYYRAENPKSHYDTSGDSMTQAKYLLYEALVALEEAGFDFSTLSTDEDDAILAINILYAGYPTQGWAEGLWPHQGWMNTFYADDVHSENYQITNIGNLPTLRTLVHENGHMICDYRDLYDYGGDSSGVGSFCVMAGAAVPDISPVPVNAYYRHMVGWDDSVDITDAAPGTVFSMASNKNDSYYFHNAGNEYEFFFIESRFKDEGLNGPLLGHGVLIWHVDEWQNDTLNPDGNNNNNQQMTPTSHYYVSLEQADGLFQLEYNMGSGGPMDPYFEGNADEFSDDTFPNAHWWDGSESGIHIGNISPISENMYFTIGADPITLYSVSGTVTGLLKDVENTLHFTGPYGGIVPVADDGTFTLTGLPAGTYTLRARSNQYYSGDVEVVVTQNTTDVALTILMPDVDVDTSPIAITVNDIFTYGTAELAISNPGEGALTYASMVATPHTDVVINEVFTAGTNPPDGVEIWNRGTDLYMGGWKLILKDDAGTSGDYTFPDQFVLGAGDLVIITDDGWLSNTDELFLGFNPNWNYTDSTVLSVALTDGLGNGVDFFKSMGSTEEPPPGTTWDGAGVELTALTNERINNDDTNTAADWSSNGSATLNQLNEGQTAVTPEETEIWLSVSPASGTVDGSADKTLTLIANGTDYPIGTEVTETLYIHHNVPDGPAPFEIEVTMTVEKGVPPIPPGGDDPDTDSDTGTDSDADAGPGDGGGGGDDGCGCVAAGTTTGASLLQSILSLIFS